MRVRLDYFDQNEDFASVLPREGTIERFLLSADGGRWALFHLDSKAEYESQTRLEYFDQNEDFASVLPREETLNFLTRPGYRGKRGRAQRAYWHRISRSQIRR